MERITTPDERIARLETSVEGLHSEFREIRGTLDVIQNALSKSKETNWSVIFAGLAVAGSFYAAAIRPIDRDLERQTQGAIKLSEAVLIQNDKAHILERATMELDKRLALIEFQSKAPWPARP